MSFSHDYILLLLSYEMPGKLCGLRLINDLNEQLLLQPVLFVLAGPLQASSQCNMP